MRHKSKTLLANIHIVFPFYKRLGIVLSILFLFSLTHFSQQSYANEMAETYIKQARDHLNLFQYDKAKGLLRAAIKLDPDNWEVFYLVGKVLIKQKQIAKSEQYLKKALKLSPDNIDSQKALAGVYLMFAKKAKASGNNSSMLDNMHKACKAYPQHTKIWANIMRLWQSSGEVDKIIANGDIVLDNNSKQLSQGDDKNLQEALTIIAIAYFNKNEIVEASKFAKKASMIRQTNDDLYNLKRKIKNKSVSAANKLIKEAKAMVVSKEYGAAVRLFKKAQKTHPSISGEIHPLIAEAEKQFKLANLKRLVDTAVKNKRYKSALDILDNAYGLYPEEEAIEIRAASISTTLDKQEKAIKASKDKINRIKRKKQAWIKRYKLHIKEGNKNYKSKKYSVAILSYQQALEMKPSSKQLASRIAQLQKLVEEQNKEIVEFNLKLEEANGVYDSNNYADAYEKYISLLSEYPEQKKVFAVKYALSSLQLGNFDEAKQIAVDFENDEVNSGSYNYINGICSYENGDHSACLEYFAKIKDDDTSNYKDVSKIKFKIYLNKYKFGLLMVLGLFMFPIVRIIRETFGNIRQKAILRKIESIKEKSTYAENIKFLEERFEKEDTPDKKLIMAMYTDALYRTEKYDRAFELGKNLLKKDGRNAIVKRIVGECALAIQDTAANSLELIQSLYKLDESRRDIVTFLAKTYMSQQADHKQAQEFIVKYIQVATTEREPILYLANVYLKRENYSRDSLSILERAIKLEPEIIDYYVGYINNLKKLDLDDDVIRFTEEAKVKFPNDAHMFGDKLKLAPVSSSGYPDYDTIGQAQPSNLSNPYPDYDSIGETPQEPSLSSISASGYPDYDAIGQANSDNSSSIEGKPGDKGIQNPAVAPVIGKDQVPCPHCKAANSSREYYCTSCGKSLGG